MPLAWGHAQFWLNAANKMRVTAETVGDADSATRLAMLLIAEEYAAVAKRAYDEATGGPATGGDAPRGPAPQQPITTAKEA